MKSRLTCLLVMALAVGWLSTSLNAEPIGFIMWSVNIPGTAGEFDIVNMTGPNSSIFPDTTFPVSTSVHLSSLSLTVNFESGPSSTFGPSYFTLEADGLSYAGGAIAIGGANPLPVDATLTGTFSPLLITLNDGSTETISPAFIAKIVTSGAPGDALVDGDFAIIGARTGGGPPPVPEPSSWLLLGTAVVGLLIFQNRRRFSVLCSAVKGHGVLRIVLFVCCMMVLQSASWAAVNLNFNTSPGSGVAGVSQVWVVGTNFPAGVITPANVNVTLATTCGGAASATTTALAVQTVIGTSRKVKFLVPASLASGLYYVNISDSVDAAAFTSANCSQIQVTHTSTTLSGCAPASSLGIYSPASGPAEVTALSPLGCWSCSGKGVKVVQLETGGGPVTPSVLLPTGSVVNSCAVNPATGEGICVANDKNVYTFNTPARTMTGTFLSGSNASTFFSGGGCMNCGIAVDALNNHAVIAMGYSPSASASAIQVFDLATHTFPALPVPMFHQVSEDIVINPLTGQYLSASESNNFDILPFTGSTGAPTGQFGNFISTIGGELDSTAVDCSTGIIAAPSEFTEKIVLADSTQATFVPGSPGTWSAPSTVFNFPSTSLSAGASAMVIAPGSSHLAAITGEFGGSSFIVAQLPSVSGAPNPAPTVVDWAYVPCVNGLSAGFDPHTVSAYTSPNDGKAYAVFANGAPPSSLFRADLAGVLARPRNAGTHTVTGDGGGACLAAGDGVIFSTGPI